MSKLKKPWLAALLNIALPGLGYVYAGKRNVLGIGLVVTSVFLYWVVELHDLPIYIWVDSFVTSLLFGYDVYKDTEAVNIDNK